MKKIGWFKWGWVNSSLFTHLNGCNGDGNGNGNDDDDDDDSKGNGDGDLFQMSHAEKDWRVE